MACVQECVDGGVPFSNAVGEAVPCWPGRIRRRLGGDRDDVGCARLVRQDLQTEAVGGDGALGGFAEVVP